MAGRVYEERFFDLPLVAVPDWELCERLEKLLTQGGLPVGIPLLEALGSSATWTARDARGEYRDKTLADFRRAVNEQEQPPHTIQLVWQGTEGMVNVYASTTIGSGGSVQSRNEAFVNHVATRVRELYAQAAERLAEPELVLAEPLPEPSSPEPSAFRRFLYAPWTIAIGSALVVAAIIALVVFVL